MRVQVATPERIVFDGQADDIVLEAEKGQLNILDRHTNLISFVRKGPLVLKSSGQTRRFLLGEGVLKIEGERLNILSPQVQELD